MLDANFTACTHEYKWIPDYVRPCFWRRPLSALLQGCSSSAGCLSLWLTYWTPTAGHATCLPGFTVLSLGWAMSTAPSTRLSTLPLTSSSDGPSSRSSAAEGCSVPGKFLKKRNRVGALELRLFGGDHRCWLWRQLWEVLLQRQAWARRGNDAIVCNKCKQKRKL